MADSVIAPVLRDFIKKNISGSISANSSMDIEFTDTGASILFIYARIPYNFKSIVQPVTLNNYYGYNWGNPIYNYAYGDLSGNIVITASNNIITITNNSSDTLRYKILCIGAFTS